MGMQKLNWSNIMQKYQRSGKKKTSVDLHGRHPARAASKEKLRQQFAL